MGEGERSIVTDVIDAGILGDQRGCEAEETRGAGVW